MAKKETTLVPKRSWEDPFALLRELTTDFTPFFNEGGWPTAGWPAFRAERGAEAAWQPGIDVFERNKRLITRIDLPGLKKEDIKVEVTGGHLAISGERKREEEEKGEEFYRREREYGSFYRAVQLPEGVKPEDVKATFDDGVLEVSMPLPVTQETTVRKVIVEEPVKAKSAA